MATVYTVKQVARLLNVGDATVYKLANSGELASTRIGNQIRFTAAALRDRLNLGPNEALIVPPEPTHVADKT